jgi:hypothetical protein
MDFNLHLFKMTKKAPSRKKSILRLEHSNSILKVDVTKRNKILPKLVSSMPDNLPAIREQTELYFKGKEANITTSQEVVKNVASPQLDIKKTNNRVKLPKLSKSYKFVVKKNNFQGIIKKPFDATTDEDLESQQGSIKKKLSIIKTGTPTKEPRVNSSKSNRSNKSIKAAIKKRVSVQTTQTTATIDKFDDNKTPEPLEPLSQFEPYEDFIRRMNKNSDIDRETSPTTDSIWPSDWAKITKKKEDPLKKLNLRIGSIFSEDANYAMLKTYEDMIYYDLISIYPETKPAKLERMKTEIFKRVPRKLTDPSGINISAENEDHIELPEIPKIIVPNKLVNTKNKTVANLPPIITREKQIENEKEKLNKHKYTISRQLDLAMKISDVCKKAKGQFVPNSDNLKTKNPLNEYNNWKANWNNYILNN